VPAAEVRAEREAVEPGKITEELRETWIQRQVR
jgi:hypothetical protein